MLIYAGVKSRATKILRRGFPLAPPAISCYSIYRMLRAIYISGKTVKVCREITWRQSIFAGFRSPPELVGTIKGQTSHGEIACLTYD
jgi:hypothetical protein